ncbi:hypothetical protein [Ligilactobacillus araffinosus]|uniref:Uncharacterized protein n=1 Tax=Ligilactobacillus araffinosus DSM 20653 TaxID=1423820 RepID=A0A0R1ZE96_9LACO|nr:hypothetical protein [Ligilactobacillus araffinosus]KRM52993.1 hypothetical protein FC64_GL000136 [Ligilactobacillus araffinosus DSM 20653]
MLPSKSDKVSAFLISDAIIGLTLISLAIATFYFNQSCFMKNEDELYLKNLQVQEAFQQSILRINQKEPLGQIKVHSDAGEYQVNVEK